MKWNSVETLPRELDSVIGWAKLFGDESYFSHEVYYSKGQWYSVRKSPREKVVSILAWMPMPKFEE